MKSITGLIPQNAADLRRALLVFAFYCVLNHIVGTTFWHRNYSLAQEANTEQIVFFSIPIGVESAPVYASPSNESYRTGVILKDQYVEVYFRNKDGFCAIRPPRGSFSWVNGKFVEIENNNSGKIVSTSGKAAPSRVGANTPIESSVVQVGLQPGQKIKILGRTTLDDGSHWFKIAPPPGEFRWIESNALFQDEATRNLPSKITTKNEYVAHGKSNGLIQANAEESAKQMRADANDDLPLPKFDDADEPLGYSPIEQPQNLSGAIASIDVNSFMKEVDKLGDDVRQTLGNRPVSIENVKILELRVESLFDAAPDDSIRFTLQKLYDSLKLAEKEYEQQLASTRAHAPANNATGQAQRFQENRVMPNAIPGTAVAPSQTSLNNAGLSFNAPTESFSSNNRANMASRDGIGQFPNNSSAQFANPNIGRPVLTPKTSQAQNNRRQTTTNVQWAQVLDEQGRKQILPIDQNGNVIDPSLLRVPTNNIASSVASNLKSNVNRNNSALGVLPSGYVSKGNSEQNVPKKPSLDFAFSKKNSPFNNKLQNAKIASGTTNDQAETNLSRLPSLFPSAQIIVPPQDYNQGIADNSVRQNSKLVAQALKNSTKERTAPSSTTGATFNEIPETSIATNELGQLPKSTGTLVFQEPRIGDDEIHSATSSRVSQVRSMQQASQNKNEQISPAATNTPRKQSRVRQTSFTPVVVRTKDGFDAKGTLIATASYGEGGPKFAIINQTGGELNIVAYVTPGKGVVLERFIGKQVGLKGSIGTVRVNDKVHKLVIANSVFPQ